MLICLATAPLWAQLFVNTPGKSSRGWSKYIGPHNHVGKRGAVLSCLPASPAMALTPFWEVNQCVADSSCVCLSPSVCLWLSLSLNPSFKWMNKSGKKYSKKGRKRKAFSSSIIWSARKLFFLARHQEVWSDWEKLCTLLCRFAQWSGFFLFLLLVILCGYYHLQVYCYRYTML